MPTLKTQIDQEIAQRSGNYGGRHCDWHSQIMRSISIVSSAATFCPVSRGLTGLGAVGLFAAVERVGASTDRLRVTSKTLWLPSTLLPVPNLETLGGCPHQPFGRRASTSLFAIAMADVVVSSRTAGNIIRITQPMRYQYMG